MCRNVGALMDGVIAVDISVRPRHPCNVPLPFAAGSSGVDPCAAKADQLELSRTTDLSASADCQVDVLSGSIVARNSLPASTATTCKRMSHAFYVHHSWEPATCIGKEETKTESAVFLCKPAKSVCKISPTATGKFTQGWLVRIEMHNFCIQRLILFQGDLTLASLLEVDCIYSGWNPRPTTNHGRDTEVANILGLGP